MGGAGTIIARRAFWLGVRLRFANLTYGTGSLEAAMEAGGSIPSTYGTIASPVLVMLGKSGVVL